MVTALGHWHRKRRWIGIAIALALVICLTTGDAIVAETTAESTALLVGTLTIKQRFATSRRRNVARRKSELSGASIFRFGYANGDGMLAGLLGRAIGQQVSALHLARNACGDGFKFST